MGDSASEQGNKTAPMNQDRPALSVVIPARNEERRLPKTLRLIREWIARSGRETEVIPVVQGHDGTTALVEREALHDPSLRPVIQHEGEGKGMAVRLGVTAARGDIILFTDADLSVPVECLENLVAMLETRPHLAGILGSRRLPESNIVIRQPLMRRVSGKAFNIALKAGGLTRFADTQCGCKLFRHDAAKEIFAKSELDGFAFDVEILNIAERLGHRMEEMPVTWADAGGSRVWLPRDGFRALRDAWLLRKRFPREQVERA
jgi:dolichyl-phosphate beta-glucosyltransferase